MGQPAQQFNSSRNVYLDLDEHGVVRQLVHTHAPVAIAAATPQLVAAAYLQQFAGLLGVQTAQLVNLGSPPSKNVDGSPVEFRFLREKHQFDTATVA